MTTKRKPADYVKAIRETRGALSAVADRLGVDVRTVYRARDRWPVVRDAIEEARERQLDFTEIKLHQLIADGNITAIIFYLKTQGKKRGYIEHPIDLTLVSIVQKIRHPAQLEGLNDKELDRLAAYVELRGLGRPKRLADFERTSDEGLDAAP